MRLYIPMGWRRLEELVELDQLVGPLRACGVDPAWRAGTPEASEDEWEFEAQLAAAESLADLGGGVVLAVDVDVPDPEPVDGWVTVAGPIQRTDAAAALTTDLAWYGVQEIPGLLEDR